jgi:hypothetical protein
MGQAGVLKKKADEKSEVFCFPLPVLKVIQADRLDIFAEAIDNGFHGKRCFFGIIGSCACIHIIFASIKADYIIISNLRQQKNNVAYHARKN